MNWDCKQQIIKPAKPTLLVGCQDIPVRRIHYQARTKPWQMRLVLQSQAKDAHLNSNYLTERGEELSEVVIVGLGKMCYNLNTESQRAKGGLPS